MQAQQTTTPQDEAAADISVATIHITGQAPYQLILLPGDVDEVTHEEATAWAAEQGGALPNRFEQALLFAHHKDAFEADWYWSDTPPASDADYAWGQGFGHGYQGFSHRDGRLRARAVRRLPI